MPDSWDARRNRRNLGRNRFEMKIALREWNLDSLLAKRFEDSEVEIALQSLRRLHLADRPHTKLKVQ